MGAAGTVSHWEVSASRGVRWARDEAVTRPSREREDGGSRAQQHELLTAILSERSSPVLVMASDGTLLAWNRTVVSYMTLSQCMEWRAGRLWLVPGGLALDATYVRRHAKICDKESPQPQTLCLEIPTRGREPRLFAEVRPIAIDGVGSWLVSLYRSVGWRRPRVGALQRLLGLTAAEARLVVALYVCPVLREAASEVHVAYETARAQIKQAFRKCEVRNQAELVRLIADGPFF